MVEELLFRGYFQRRLAEDWGDGPAIIGTACFFTLAHPQYLIPNAYNITMVASLLCLAIGLGVVFAWTRSLFPSMIAHAIINVPLTPAWQGVLLLVFVVGIFVAWRGGMRAARRIFSTARVAVCILLATVLAIYVVAAHRIQAMTPVAIGLLAVALLLQLLIRREEQATSSRAIPA